MNVFLQLRVLPLLALAAAAAAACVVVKPDNGACNRVAGATAGTAGRGGAPASNGGGGGKGGKAGTSEMGGARATGGMRATGGTGDVSAAGAGEVPAKAAMDDFERAELGASWGVIYPSGAASAQLQIIGESDLGMVAGKQSFFLSDWVADRFSADQYCEAEISAEAPEDWVYILYVRRQADGPRYGFFYDNDMSQPNYGEWIFRYDGVASPAIRLVANATATTPPAPGDTLRVEIVGSTLKGYLNGELVLEGTDSDASAIADGRPGLAARLTTGDGTLAADTKIWESFAAGDM